MAGVLVRKVHGWGRVDIDHRVTVSPWRNGFDTWALVPVLNLQGGNQWTSSNRALCKWMNQWEMCVKNHQLDVTTRQFYFLFLYSFEFRFGTAHHLLSEKDISNTFSRLKLPGTRLFTTQSEYAWFSGLHWDTPSVGNQCRNKKASISCCQPWCLAGFDL